jgi:outer membrane protein W
MGVSSIIQQVFMLIPYIGLGIHYFSLREQKDGSGLEDRLEQLGSGGSQHGHIEEQY